MPADGRVRARPVGSSGSLGRQRGYLQEAPIALAVVVLGTLVLLPFLPRWGQKMLASLATALALGLLYYLIVIPGWRPGAATDGPAGAKRWLFVLVAAVALGALAYFVLCAA
jgi:uncharacterized membrane protein